MFLKNIIVRPVQKSEEGKYKILLQKHHYLGFMPKIGETIWYIATIENEWISLLSFSASALKCKIRDEWIGWSYRHQYSRLKLVVNNSRFLILPGWHKPNTASRIISLCLKRLVSDWLMKFGHKILLVETFVDPSRFEGTVYKASNWLYLGNTKGYKRIKGGYSSEVGNAKMMFVKPLHRKAKWILSHSLINETYVSGEIKMNITADHMRSLPYFFGNVSDPRRGQGKRHQLTTVLALCAGAILCGMRGYKSISDWTKSLGQKARERFNCRYSGGKYQVPSEYIIRDILVRVNPDDLDKALIQWNETYGGEDESLAIDGKVMCNAIDEEGNQTHIMSVIGHDTKQCYTQKKSVQYQLTTNRIKKNRRMKLK